MGLHIEDLYIHYKPHTFNRHMKYFYGRHDGYIQGVSRKTKKAMIGRKWGKAKLKRRIAAVIITKHTYPHEAELSDCFCPKCGCDRTRSTGNMTEYPEAWYRSYCLRCGFLVAETDNSPNVHVLELMCGEDKAEFDWKHWG